MNETPRRPGRMLPAAVFAMPLLLLAVPGPLLGTFDGLPWSSWWEVAVAAVLVGVCSAASARAWVLDVIFWSSLRRTSWFVVLGLLCLAKVGMFMGGPGVGYFEACYRGISNERVDTDCSVSFENLWRADEVTRFDPSIDFRPARASSSTIEGSNWDLAMVNDVRFNTFGEDTTLIRYDRFPFHAQWRGQVNAPRDQVVTFEYVGGVTVTADDRPLLAASDSYEAVRSASVTIPAGTQTVTVEYRFESTALLAQTPQGPYATLSVEGLEPAGAPLATRLLVGLVDAVVFALGFAGLLLLGSQWRPYWRQLLGASGVMAVTWGAASRGVLPELPHSSLALVTLAGAFLLLILTVQSPGSLLAVGAPLVLFLALERSLSRVGHLGEVLFRSRGDDWVAYQSFARSILSERSLRAGEDVYFFMPGFRYVLFVIRTLVGDSDALAAAVFTGAFLLLSVLVVNRVLSVGHDRFMRWYGGAVLATLVIFGGSEYFVEKAIDGLGEVPTWLFPLGVVLMALRPVRPSTIMVMALLAGLVVAIRPNQGIGMVVSLALLMFLRDPPTWRWPIRRAVAPGVAFASVLVLLLAHNVYYGGDWIVFPRLVPGIMDLPPSDLVLVFSDPDVRGLLLDKVRAMFHLGSSRDDVANPLVSPFLPMQVLWLAALWVVLRHRRGWRYPNWMVVLWPMGYAAGHVNYTVWVYYPRHIVPFNLALMLSGLLLVAWRKPSTTQSIVNKELVG